MRWVPLMLMVCLLAGCQPSVPPEPPVAPMAEDLSHWTLPELVQPELPEFSSNVAKPRTATAAETVYDYVPGGVYKLTVALDAPLDVILEPGEKVQTLIGSDPKPIMQGTVQGQDPQQPQVKQRWEYKEGVVGVGETASARIFLRALEPGATLGLTVLTSKRAYYFSCTSVAKSQVRAVWWKYPPELGATTGQAAKALRLLPDPREPKLYHVGYQLSTTTPAWTPRHIVDDGKKLYLVYPEVTLFGTVPLVRAIGPNGPQVINSRQFLNVVILDALAPRLELRVGIGEKAEVLTITRGPLRTIQCPDDAACPVWPAAAQQLAGR